MIMSPPLPPSPPEGPPRGTNFSRRKAMQPLPPSPALTRIFASSMNIGYAASPWQLVESSGFSSTITKEGVQKNKSLCLKAKACSVDLTRAISRRDSHHESELLRFQWFDHHKLAHLSLVQELDPAGDLGEERVVFAATHVQPRLDRGAALPHDDGSARHDLPAECFKSKPLRVRIAAVS